MVYLKAAIFGEILLTEFLNREILKANGNQESIYNLKRYKKEQFNMKKKKVAVMNSHNVWNSDLIKISQESNSYYFEIGTELTTDLSEAVSMMMRMKSKWNDEVWNLKIENIDYYEIEPSKCLYWLSGGDDEWMGGENYKKLWHEAYLEFQEEFGIMVISILKKSKTLKDVRNGFLKHLNLATIYNFAIEREIA
jgi:hypothetical protein